MSRWVYWIKKALNWNWRYCSKFCVTCKYYEICKNDDVLSQEDKSMKCINVDLEMNPIAKEYKEKKQIS